MIKVSPFVGHFELFDVCRIAFVVLSRLEVRTWDIGNLKEILQDHRLKRGLRHHMDLKRRMYPHRLDLGMNCLSGGLALSSWCPVQTDPIMRPAGKLI